MKMRYNITKPLVDCINIILKMNFTNDICILTLTQL